MAVITAISQIRSIVRCFSADKYDSDIEFVANREIFVIKYTAFKLSKYLLFTARRMHVLMPMLRRNIRTIQGTFDPEKIDLYLQVQLTPKIPYIVVLFITVALAALHMKFNNVGWSLIFLFCSIPRFSRNVFSKLLRINYLRPVIRCSSFLGIYQNLSSKFLIRTLDAAPVHLLNNILYYRLTDFQFQNAFPALLFCIIVSPSIDVSSAFAPSQPRPRSDRYHFKESPCESRCCQQLQWGSDWCFPSCWGVL